MATKIRNSTRQLVQYLIENNSHILKTKENDNENGKESGKKNGIEYRVFSISLEMMETPPSNLQVEIDQIFVSSLMSHLKNNTGNINNEKENKKLVILPTRNIKKPGGEWFITGQTTSFDDECDFYNSSDLYKKISPSVIPEKFSNLKSQCLVFVSNVHIISNFNTTTTRKNSKQNTSQNNKNEQVTVCLWEKPQLFICHHQTYWINFLQTIHDYLQNNNLKEKEQEKENTEIEKEKEKEITEIICPISTLLSFPVKSLVFLLNLTVKYPNLKIIVPKELQSRLSLELESCHLLYSLKNNYPKIEKTQKNKIVQTDLTKLVENQNQNQEKEKNEKNEKDKKEKEQEKIPETHKWNKLRDNIKNPVIKKEKEQTEKKDQIKKEKKNDKKQKENVKRKIKIKNKPFELKKAKKDTHSKTTMEKKNTDKKHLEKKHTKGFTF